MKRVNLFLWINEWCNLDCSYCNVVKTQKKLDKDRFRRDLGDVVDAYNEVAARLGILKENPKTPPALSLVQNEQDND